MKKFRSFVSEGNKEEYKKFFDAKLKKYDVKSPAELSDADKKKFYDEIDADWESDAEEDGDKEKGESVKEYIKHDGKRRRTSGGDGRRRSVKSKRALETEEEDCDEDELEEQNLNEAMYSDKQIKAACKKMKMSPAEGGEFYSYLEGK